MTTQPRPDALRQRLLDHAACHESDHWLMADDEQRQWASDLREAEALIGRLHAECDALRADRDSWERQCSDRVDDAVEFVRQRDEARAECEALRADAERYRWLRGEHKRVDPLCHVVWKRNGDRHGSEWVNTAELDAAIDAARAAKEQA